MSMGAEVIKASGRATCIVCGRKIEKNMPQIVIWGYRESGRIHSCQNQCSLTKRITR